MPAIAADPRVPSGMMVMFDPMGGQFSMAPVGGEDGVSGTIEFIQKGNRIVQHIVSDAIYTKDSKGAIRFWRFEVEGDKWRGVSGHVGGTEVFSGWSYCTPKSQDTAEAQALFEAHAERKKKLDRLYRETTDNLDDVYIKPMLAQEYDKLKKPLVFPVFVQPKLDGIRAIITKDGATTRQGQPINSISHIIEELEPVFAAYPDLVLDGELYNHDLREDFNSLSSVIRAGFKLDKKALKAGVSEEEQRAALLKKQRAVIQYHVYDIADPDAGEFSARISLLEDIFWDEFPNDYVMVVRTGQADDQDELDHDLIECLENGYEGQMVRQIKSVYEHTRSKNLLKRKDFTTKEFKVLRIEEGNGNWHGKAKRVVFELEDGRENEAGIRGSFDFCAALLANAPHYEKGWVTIRFMNQRTPDGKLRAPVAIDWHPEGRKD